MTTLHPLARRLALVTTTLALAGAAQAQVGPVSPTPRGAAATPAWLQRYDHGILGHDSGSCVAVDSHGNVLACGSSLGQYGSSFLYDTTTLKYAPDGTLAWEQRFHGKGSGFNSGAVAVTTDANDDVYVLANDPGSTGNQDILLLAYSAAGALQWLYRYDNNWSEGGVGLVVDPGGAIYVAGSSYFAGNVTDIVLLKVDASGSLVWARNWHGGFGTDWPVGIALDPHGNVDLVGNSIQVSAGTNFDWVALEYDPSGNLLWTSFLAGALLAPDYSKAMAVAPDGEVCATGYLVQTSGNQHHATARWSDTGALVWKHVFPTASGGGEAVAFDGAGRAYVAGQAGLVAYGRTGNVRWQRPFQLAGSLWSRARFLRMLPVGPIAVGGSTSYSGSDEQLATVLFDLGGNELHQYVLGPPDGGAPGGMCSKGPRLILDGSGSNGHDQDMLTLSLLVQ